MYGSPPPWQVVYMCFPERQWSLNDSALAAIPCYSCKNRGLSLKSKSLTPPYMIHVCELSLSLSLSLCATTAIQGEGRSLLGISSKFRCSCGAYNRCDSISFLQYLPGICAYLSSAFCISDLYRIQYRVSRFARSAITNDLLDSILRQFALKVQEGDCVRQSR